MQSEKFVTNFFITGNCNTWISTNNPSLQANFMPKTSSWGG